MSRIAVACMLWNRFAVHLGCFFGLQVGNDLWGCSFHKRRLEMLHLRRWLKRALAAHGWGSRSRHLHWLLLSSH